MYIDYLIVGQGLAGSIVAEHCLLKGLKIKVVAAPHLSTSSLVAGGLYNPITGRKMVKTWNCDELFDYLIPFYQTLEEKLNQQFLHDLPIYRPFLSVEAQNEWMGKSADSGFSSYIEKSFSSAAYAQLKDDFGGILLKRSGYLDTKHFVEVYGDYLQNKDLLIHEVFDNSAVSRNGQNVHYKGIEAKGIIFCEGSAVKDNELFNWLPFRPVKGELLTIKSEHQPKVIYNRGVFVIGKEEGRSTVGATYDHHELNLEATEKGRNQLIEKLEKLINYDYQIVEQKVGIRPATADRRPIIGEHPQEKSMYIFNGLGAKGVSLAPYYANQMVDHLINDAKLDDEVNIERYFSLF